MCEQGDVSCELSNLNERVGELVQQVERLVEASSGASFSDFMSTLLATLMGAAIAGAIAWWLARREGDERYESGVVAHVEAMSEAMTVWARSHELFLRNPGVPGIPEPDRTALDVALDLLIARTKGGDRVVAEQFRTVVYQQTFIRDPDWIGPETAAIRRAAATWCARKWSNAETTEALRVFDSRHENKEANPADKQWELLPSAPNPYKRAVGLNER